MLILKYFYMWEKTLVIHTCVIQNAQCKPHKKIIYRTVEVFVVHIDFTADEPDCSQDDAAL